MGCRFLLQGIFQTEIKPASPALAGGFFTTEPPGKPYITSIVVVVVKSLSHVRPFATPWTVAHQGLLFMGFSRLGYWSELPFLPPGDLLDPGMEPMSPASVGGFFTTELPGKPNNHDRG